MYSFERYFGKFKKYVKNKARVEGSIAEAYLHVDKPELFFDVRP